MTFSVTHTNFNPLDLIESAKIDTNFADLVNGGNTHEAATTGIHGVGAGSIVGTTLAQALTNKDITKSVILGQNGVFNMGCTLSGGVFTLTQANGSAFSATDFGGICMASSTAGQMRVLKVTAPASINDDSHASSDLTNIGFGITEAANYSNDRFFWIYAINRNDTDFTATDGDSKFCLSMNPAMQKTPSSSALIGDTAAAPATDNKNSIIIFGTVTEANYTSLPVKRIGAIRMRWSSSTTDWTIQTLTSYDGISQEALIYSFSQSQTYPTGQNGASASTHLLPNAGTAPIFTTANYEFISHPNGDITVMGSFSGDGGTDGAGAVTSLLALPATTVTSATLIPCGHALGATTMTTGSHMFVTLTGGLGYGTLSYSNATTDITAIQNGFFTNGSRTMSFYFKYNAFSTTP